MNYISRLFLICWGVFCLFAVSPCLAASVAPLSGDVQVIGDNSSTAPLSHNVRVIRVKPSDASPSDNTQTIRAKTSAAPTSGDIQAIRVKRSTAPTSGDIQAIRAKTSTAPLPGDTQAIRVKTSTAPLPGDAKTIRVKPSPSEKRVAPQNRYTLADAVARALEANPGVEAKLRALEEAQMQIGVAKSYFFPTASVFYQLNKLDNSGGVGSSDELSNNSHSHGLRTGLNLFSGFAHLNNLEQTKLQADVESARHLQAKMELIGNVQLSFLQLLKFRENMKTVMDAKKRLETQLAAAQEFVRLKMAPQLNVLQTEVELSRLLQEEITAANHIRSAEVQLGHYLGLPLQSPAVYVGSLHDYAMVQDMDEVAAVNMAINNRPEAIIALKSIAVAEKKTYVSAAKYLPVVSANYDVAYYSRDYDGGPENSYNDYSRHYSSVGLSFSWDLFQGGATTYSVLADKKRIAALRKEYENTLSSIRTEVVQNLMDMDAARELVVAAGKGVDAATEAYNMSEARYNARIGTITDLLDAQAKLTLSEGDASQALADFHSARARFFYSIGTERIELR
ncbi:TolC family protein [Desulfosarcina sp. OttesenSCG-928-A07]|nr:TolC family protein [Desulfosarcina sp. OttesenSCG-928-A07]